MLVPAHAPGAFPRMPRPARAQSTSGKVPRSIIIPISLLALHSPHSAAFCPCRLCICCARAACCNRCHARPRGVLLPVVQGPSDRSAPPRGTVSCTLLPARCVVCAPRSHAGKHSTLSDEELIPDFRTSSRADGGCDSVGRFRAVHQTGDVHVVSRCVHAS